VEAFAAWSKSQHALAIQEATAATVLGDFKQRFVSRAGEVTQFTEHDGHFGVEASGVTHTGSAQSFGRRRFDVKYTFGVYPLQQYLLDVGQGYLQALTIAYDTRPRSAGGAHWYDLQSEPVAPGDALHWTSSAYNWNTSCADCHSTQLQKNYDRRASRYDTKFSELGVGCEACHGPGSRHLEQAPSHFDASSGFAYRFPERAERRWSFSAGSPIASLEAAKNEPISTAFDATEPCAKCHAYRSDLGGPSLAFDDRYRLDLLDAPLYFSDGQIKEEVFVTGSFLQSKMYARGVICNDCHEPHSAKTRAVGNALCGNCHSLEHFDSPAHHLHPASVSGIECVSCHLPTRTFMGIDARHDHRFGVPRPDLTLSLGVPNACTESCHHEHHGAPGELPAAWAARVIREHFGPSREPSFAEALDPRSDGRPDHDAQLLGIIRDHGFPAIVRATALSHLEGAPVPAADFSAQQRDPSPLVRRTVAQLAANLPATEQRAQLIPLLADPVRSVRLEAARGLLEFPRESLSEAERAALARVSEDLRASLEYNADHPGALLDLARLELGSGEPDAPTKAEALFENALSLDPTFAGAYLNYADFLRARARDPEAAALLDRGLEKTRDRAPLEHALGLTWLRLADKPRGLAHLAAAYRLAPNTTAYGYVYAVALFDSGSQPHAVTILEQLHRRAPADRAVTEALAHYQRTLGHIERALSLETELAHEFPH